MRKFSKNIYKISFLFLTFSVLSGGEFFHHHETLLKENQCQACLFARTLSSSDVDTEPVIQNFPSFEYLLPSLELQKPEFLFQGPVSSRAPPFSS